MSLKTNVPYMIEIPSRYFQNIENSAEMKFIEATAKKTN